jgi:hypothetical protein
MRLFILVMAAFTFLTKLFAGAPEIYQPSDEGWYDLTFQIDKYEVTPDGTQNIFCSGVYKGEMVGFSVELSPSWKEGKLGSITSYQGVVSIVSRGNVSDSFIRAINSIYKTNENVTSLKKKITFSGISLEGDPRSLKQGLVKIKLFFESDQEEDYAEAYLNIDFGKKRAELAEKDESYREPLVRALRQ